MKVIINSKVTLNKGIKGKCREYSIVLHQSNLNELTIRSISPDGKDKRIAGTINRAGELKLSPKHQHLVRHLITDKALVKVNMLLDFIFGAKRDKFPTEVDIKGYTEFKK